MIQILEGFLTPSQVAEQKNCTYQHIKHCVKNGKLDGLQVGNYIYVADNEKLKSFQVGGKGQKPEKYFLPKPEAEKVKVRLEFTT